MDFSTSIGLKTKAHETFPEVMEFIAQEIAQWNAYDPQGKLVIKIKKVPGQTETVGIHAQDQSTAQEKIS